MHIQTLTPSEIWLSLRVTQGKHRQFLETKTDDSFPVGQFITDVFSPPYGLIARVMVSWKIII